MQHFAVLENNGHLKKLSQLQSSRRPSSFCSPVSALDIERVRYYYSLSMWLLAHVANFCPSLPAWLAGDDVVRVLVVLSGFGPDALKWMPLAQKIPQQNNKQVLESSSFGQGGDRMVGGGREGRWWWIRVGIEEEDGVEMKGRDEEWIRGWEEYLME